MLGREAGVDLNAKKTMDVCISRHQNSGYNNSIQFFIIYVPSQQPQHSIDTDNYIMDKHNIKSKTS
jgi:hypothetical protein